MAIVGAVVSMTMSLLYASDTTGDYGEGKCSVIICTVLDRTPVK